MTFEAELPRHPNAASQARTHMAQFDCRLDGMRRSDAILAVSELVANAYRHGEGRICLQLDSGPRGLRARVSDEGRGFDAFADPGLGLVLVGAVTDDWGLDAQTGVWFEMH